MTIQPATTLEAAWSLCDPAAPLDPDDPRWVDLTPGRGDEGTAVEQCRKRIQRSSNPLVQLVCGQRGCGKSTELRRLGRDLEADGYAVATLDLAADLDLEDSEPTDVMVAILRCLEADLRRSGIELDGELVAGTALWLGKAVWGATRSNQVEARVRSDLGGAGTPLFARVLARLAGQIHAGGWSKTEVRRGLDPHLWQLVARIQQLVESARQAAKSQGKTDLVVLVDHLDRVALREHGAGRTNHDVLFIDRGELMKSLGCHAVFAAPVTLFFSPRLPEVRAVFPHRHLLPAVRIAERASRSPWVPGRELLRDLLARRVDVGTLFRPGIDDVLIAASGGHPQLLLTLVRSALDFVDQPPVPLEAARNGFRRLVNDYERSIPEDCWRLLARVDRFLRLKSDAVHQRLLFDLNVLAYQNGECWYGVHPAVMELQPFRDAYERLEKEIKKSARPGVPADAW